MFACNKILCIHEQTCSLYLQIWLRLNNLLLPPGVKWLIVILKALTCFYQNKNNTDFVQHKKVCKLRFCSGFRNIYFMDSALAFVLLYAFVFQRLIRIIFPKQERNLSQAKLFRWSRKFCASKDFSLIKEVFRNSRFSFH